MNGGIILMSLAGLIPNFQNKKYVFNFKKKKTKL